MTARKPKAAKPKITLSEPDGRPHSGLVIGPARIVPAAIGCPWQWDHSRRGFLVPRGRLSDVEAVLTLDGHQVEPVNRQGVLL